MTGGAIYFYWLIDARWCCGMLAKDATCVRRFMLKFKFKFTSTWTLITSKRELECQALDSTVFLFFIEHEDGRSIYMTFYFFWDKKIGWYLLVTHISFDPRRLVSSSCENIACQNDVVQSDKHRGHQNQPTLGQKGGLCGIRHYFQTDPSHCAVRNNI